MVKKFLGIWFLYFFVCVGAWAFDIQRFDVYDGAQKIGFFYYQIFGDRDDKEYRVEGLYQNQHGPLYFFSGMKQKNGYTHMQAYDTAVKEGSEYSTEHKKPLGFIKFLDDWNHPLKDLSGTFLPKMGAQLRFQRVEPLNDKLEGTTFKQLSIPMLATYKDYFFVGLYNKRKDDRSAGMHTLRVYHKASGALYQSLSIRQLEEQYAGSLMDSIFLNLDVVMDNNPKLRREYLKLWTKYEPHGGYFIVKYHPKTKKFRISDAPENDGPTDRFHWG